MKLKCPYPECGGNAKIRKYVAGGYAVQCVNPNCFCIGRLAGTKEQAISNWLRLSADTDQNPIGNFDLTNEQATRLLAALGFYGEGGAK